MAFTEKRLAGPTAPSAGGPTTIYTCPTAQTTTTILKQLAVCNAGGSSTTFTVNLVPTGSSVAVSNRIISSVSIPANETIFFDLSQVMNSGDFVSVLPGGSNVVFTLSGVENAGGMVVSGLADSAVTTAKIADSNITASKLGPDAFLANNQAGAIITMEMM